MLVFLRNPCMDSSSPPRQWYKKFDTCVLSIGFKRSSYDGCFYMKKTCSGVIVFLLIYMDDMLSACQDMVEIQELKRSLKSEFNMKDLEATKKILSMEINRNKKCGTLFLS